MVTKLVNKHDSETRFQALSKAAIYGHMSTVAKQYKSPRRSHIVCRTCERDQQRQPHGTLSRPRATDRETCSVVPPSARRQTRSRPESTATGYEPALDGLAISERHLTLVPTTCRNRCVIATPEANIISFPNSHTRSRLKSTDMASSSRRAELMETTSDESSYS